MRTSTRNTIIAGALTAAVLAGFVTATHYDPIQDRLHKEQTYRTHPEVLNKLDQVKEGARRDSQIFHK